MDTTTAVEKWTPLMMCGANGNAAVAQLLLAKGANALLRDQNGKTALDLALSGGWKTAKISKLLKEHGERQMAAKVKENLRGAQATQEEEEKPEIRRRLKIDDPSLEEQKLDRMAEMDRNTEELTAIRQAGGEAAVREQQRGTARTTAQGSTREGRQFAATVVDNGIRNGVRQVDASAEFMAKEGEEETVTQRIEAVYCRIP